MDINNIHDINLDITGNNIYYTNMDVTGHNSDNINMDITGDNIRWFTRFIMELLTIKCEINQFYV